MCGLVVRVDSIKLCLDSPLDANICTTNEVTLLAQCWQRFFFLILYLLSSKPNLQSYLEEGANMRRIENIYSVTQYK